MVVLRRVSPYTGALLLFISTMSTICRGQSDWFLTEKKTYCMGGPCNLHGTGARQDNRPAFPRTLSEVRDAMNAQALDSGERLAILNASIVAFAELHAYRSLHLNVRRVDPAALLRRLSVRAQTLSPFQFHNELRDIYQRADDFHTNYLAPEPLRRAVATLPFSARIYYPRSGASPRVAVASVVSAALPPQSQLAPGVRILAIDGVPVIRFAVTLGRKGYSANSAAILTRGVSALTTRFLALDPFPEKAGVRVNFVSREGKRRTINLRWMVSPITDPNLLADLRIDVGSLGQTAREQYSAERLPLSPTKGDVHSPNRLSGKRILDPGLFSMRQPLRRTEISIIPQLSSIFSAFTLETTSGTIGVLQLFTFAVPNFPAAIAELTRVLRLMPSRGLVIDVRDNSGGSPDVARAVTELFSNVSIPSMPLQLRVTQAMQALIFSNSPNPATQFITGPFRQPFLDAAMLKEKLTPPVGDLFLFGKPAPIPRVERVYMGPVITLTNAISFSAAEIFSAIQRDTKASPVVGTDSTTGGGGCVSITYVIMHAWFPDAFPDPLPDGVDFRICILRFFRLGAQAGVLIEARGVPPDVRYFSTRRDVYDEDADLFNMLGKNLTSMASSS